MNKLKKVIKKYKKLNESQNELVILLEEQEGILKVILNGDNGVEDISEIKLNLKDKLISLFKENNVEYFEAK